MTDAALSHGHSDPHHLRGLQAASDQTGPAPKRIVTGYGFWIFLLSDIVMFACFFAAYAVLAGATNGGPTGAQLFDWRNVAIETVLLLFSSFTCGIASIAATVGSRRWFQLAMLATAVLGVCFLGLEFREFADMIARDAGPTRSAFLSAFFTLVGCHGVHVTIGLLWLLTMMAQVFAKGFRADICRRLLCFSLFWHALDIIWVAIFSMVYLLGSRA
ncbi:cytochrome (ubi)quinol oxidase subunit III [Rhodopseudomonas palustris]|uniref:cytochrome (ubi)quinol oxidase subunit III n=1 Tax=Rhodopseudomonas palustris TaxID=1076 RepID=UPI0020CBA420|nr:cytochrome (ubi)quinol oxidase subunit III [Rhodopseudomonas palustris]MCP9626165.1 cytochrome (ubi)quinol oxidase subunit III [Rhodopseudomonas palustris]